MSTSRLRLIHARQRRTSGVVRFAASPAYKLRRFAGEWSFRVHASSEFVELTESEGGEV